MASISTTRSFVISQSWLVLVKCNGNFLYHNCPDFLHGTKQMNEGEGEAPLLPRLKQIVLEYGTNRALQDLSNGSLTYDDLWSEAVLLSTKLRTEFSLGPGSLIGLAFGRSFQHVVGILASWMLGSAFLPLDLSYPKSRLNFIVAEAKPHVVLGREGFLEDGTLLSMSHLSFWVYHPASTRPVDLPPSLSYIIFTSGSSGRPKGVMVSHNGLSILFDAQREMFDISSSVRFLVLKRANVAQSRVNWAAATGFDASISIIFTALLAGGTPTIFGHSPFFIPPTLVLTFLVSPSTTTLCFVLSSSQFSYLLLVIISPQQVFSDLVCHG
jgi:acyl-CoA synthetase (AMP-forming)/AMP-acid ligase II